MTKSQVKEAERIRERVNQGAHNPVSPNLSVAGADYVVDADGTLWISQNYYDTITGETVSLGYRGTNRRGGDAGRRDTAPDGKKASVRKATNDAKNTAGKNTAKYNAEKKKARSDLKKAEKEYREAGSKSREAAQKYSDASDLAHISRGDANAIYKAQKSGKLNITSKEAGMAYDWVSEGGATMRDVSASFETKGLAATIRATANAVRSGDYKAAETIYKGYTTSVEYDEAKKKAKKYK